MELKLHQLGYNPNNSVIWYKSIEYPLVSLLLNMAIESPFLFQDLSMCKHLPEANHVYRHLSSSSSPMMTGSDLPFKSWALAAFLPRIYHYELCVMFFLFLKGFPENISLNHLKPILFFRSKSSIKKTRSIVMNYN